MKLFPIIEPETLVSFDDPRFKEYSCDNPEDAVYKTPNYYIFQGERVNVTSFSLMLRSIVDRLYEIDSSIIEGMARNNEKILSWSKNILLSYDPDVVSGTRHDKLHVKGTDIYESVGFSSTHIMYIIQALLDKYDIDRSDFLYSARDNKLDQN